VTDRRVLITIDTIACLFKDYINSEDLPLTAKPIKLLFKPTEKGKLALLFTSDLWDGPQRDYQVQFGIKRISAVGV
jgi:hypothetical protein